MKVVFVIFLLALANLLPAQSCEQLAIDGVWLDPFNNELLHVLCTNESWEEIYSYPSWLIRDLDGNVIAEEEVVFFGIVGTSHHFLDLLNPLPDNSDSMPVIMELWTGFGDSLECSFEWELAPRELEWTGTGDQGCFPVRFTAHSIDPNGCSVGLNLENGSGESIWSETLEIGASTSGWGQSDSLCLSQSECHELQVVCTPTSQVALELVDPSDELAWNLQYWSFSISNEIPIPVDTSFTLDLYGGDCEVVQAIENPEWTGDVLYPNPVAPGGLYQVPFEAGDVAALWDGLGRRTGLKLQGALNAPNKVGVYHIVVESIDSNHFYTLIVK